MKKFFVLYVAPIAAMDKMMQESTPEQRKAGMDEWMQWWMQWAKAKGEAIVDMGAPLGKNKRVTAEGISDVRNEVGGYSIVQAASHDEAAAMFSDSPHFQIPGAYVEIMEIGQM
jgi:hypothetical protein